MGPIRQVKIGWLMHFLGDSRLRPLVNQNILTGPLTWPFFQDSLSIILGAPITSAVTSVEAIGSS